MADGGGAGEEEVGPEGSPDNVRSSSPRVALLSVMGGLKPACSSHIFASPEIQIQRKPRSHDVRRAAPPHRWGFNLRPLLPPAPGKKKARKSTAKKRAKLLPEKVYVHLPPPATATTTVVSELERPPALEIQESESPPDSPILGSDVEVYLVKRTSPRRDKSPPPPPPPPAPAAEPEPAVAAPAPGNEKHEPEKWCLHCGITSTLQWRMGPAGERTLCNACGVRYRQGRLVPEYRPRVSPTFNQSEHSYKHQEVLKIRNKQDHPEPPAAYQRIRPTRKQQQPAQVRKKRNGLPPQPALLKVRKQLKGKKQHRKPPQPEALPLPPALPQAVDDMEMEQQLPPPPPVQPHADGELMMIDEPLLPPEPFLFDGPAAPKIIDDEPVVVIVIDDD